MNYCCLTTIGSLREHRLLFQHNINQPNFFPQSPEDTPPLNNEDLEKSQKQYLNRTANLYNQPHFYTPYNQYGPQYMEQQWNTFQTQHYQSDYDYTNYGRSGRRAIGQQNPQHPVNADFVWTPQRSHEYSPQQGDTDEYSPPSPPRTPRTTTYSPSTPRTTTSPPTTPYRTNPYGPRSSFTSPDIDAAPTRITLDVAQQKWLKSRFEWVENTAPRRYNNHLNRHWSTVQRILSRFTNNSTGNGITFRNLGGSNRLRMFAFQQGGQTWYIRPAITWRATRIGPSLYGRQSLVLVHEKDPLMQAVVRVSHIRINPTTFNFTRVGEALDRARKQRKSEVDDAANMRSFDFPRDRRVGYIGLYDQSDPTERQQLLHFPGLMNQQGYRFAAPEGQVAVPVTSDPIGMLRRRIRAMRSHGIRDFYISLSVHGTSTSVVFRTSSGERLSLEPAALSGLLSSSEFSDTRFFVSLNACSGGGFNAASYRTMTSGRIRVVTQAKTNVPNVILTTGGGQEYSSPYDHYLMYYINQGMPYGRAHLRADLMAKRHFPGSDANAFSSNPTGGTTTARGPERDEPPPLPGLDGGTVTV